MRLYLYYTLLTICVLMLVFSCQSPNSNASKKNLTKSPDSLSLLHPTKNYINKNNVHVFIPGQDGVPLPQQLVAGKPEIREVSGIPQITPGVSNLWSGKERQKPVLSSKPKSVALKPGNLKKFTIGKDSKAPKVYVIENPGIQDSVKKNYSVQHGDTLFQAVSKVFPQPTQREALLPRYKNDAICNIQYLDVEQGLAFSNVWAIIEDSHSNLWFGTDGAGVSKYDGKFFTNYSRREGLSDDIIRSMLEDKNGNIWFGTWAGGVDKYDGKTFTRFAKREGFCDAVVRNMLEDQHGNIWFATLGSGAYQFDGKNLTHFTTEQGLSSDSIFSMIQDKTGNIWFGTANHYLCKFDGNSFTQLTAYEEFGPVTVRAIAEDQNGTLWIGSEGKGIFSFDGKCMDSIASGNYHTNPTSKDLISKFGKPAKMITQYTVDQGLTENNIYTILIDKSDHVWAGSNRGVCRFDGNSFSHYTENEGLNNNYIRAALKDRVGNLWFGTHGGGVCRYVAESFKYMTELEGLSNRRVWSMFEDQDQNLWFGTWDGGVCKYDGKYFSCYTKTQGLTNNSVRSILQDKYGSYWFATENGGVSRFDGKYFTNYTEKQGLGKNRVRKIMEDRKGNLWFGTSEGGLTKYDGNRVRAIENGEAVPENDKLDLVKINGKYVETFRSYGLKDGLPNDNIWDLFEDKDGIIWIGTLGGGLCKFDGDSFVWYTVNEGLCSNYIRSLLPDDNGNIWIGTNGSGLSLFDGHSFTTITENDGLSNNYVRSLLKDRNGNIWIGTINGFSFIRNASKNGHVSLENKSIKNKLHIYNFGQEDGLKGLELFPNSILLDSKNQLWLGSGKALNSLDLNIFKLPVSKPHLQLNNIVISDEIIDFNSYKNTVSNPEIKFSDVANFYNYPIHVELPYYLNHLTFNFSATDWFAPTKIKYQYKLEGLDKDWSKVTFRSFADYRNIPHGKYIFKIRALGLSGLWSDTFEYPFKVRPPWWLTWWFRLLFAICLIGSGIAFYYYRLNSLMRQREQLEIKVAERTLELKKANDELGEQHMEILAKNEEILAQAENLKYNRDQLILANEHLQNQRKKLKQALKKLKKTQSQLIQSERQASIGILSSGIAHEINNPLNFIQGGIAAIESYINTNLEGHAKYLTPLIHIINNGINRATEIIISLENFNKKSNGTNSNCDIHDIINNCLVILQNRTKNKIEIQKDFTSEPYHIVGNIGDLHQAILNVLINAEESMVNKGILSIFTHVVKQKMEIVIQDTGFGISKENLTKITDPFFTTKDPGKGTGFGLSITYNIIKKHKGTIEFQSEPGIGTTVIINLPLI